MREKYIDVYEPKDLEQVEFLLDWCENNDHKVLSIKVEVEMNGLWDDDD